MKKLLNFNQEIFLLEDGVITSLGKADNMKLISQDLYAVGDEVFKINGNQIEVVAKDVNYERVYFHATARKHETLLQSFSSMRYAVPLNEVNPLLLAKHTELLEKRTYGQADGAIVLTSRSGKNIQLFLPKKGLLKNLNFDAEGKVNVDDLDDNSVIFLNSYWPSAFIYKGYAYTNLNTFRYWRDSNNKEQITNDCWTKVHKPLLMSAKEYMLFYAGVSIFALEQDGNITKLHFLGVINRVIKTENGDLVEFSDHKNTGNYELCHLGEKLEFIASRDSTSEYTIDEKTGKVSVHKRHYKYDEEGNPILKEYGEHDYIREDYDLVFENGYYKRIDH